ncbi:MAG: CPBP family intramembrane metalloprotease [Ruminococcus sp.]|nr:CPBP family intramembrane metalloprotease [Ruminococcus sp.]
MKKFLLTLACCVLSVVVLAVSQSIALAIGGLLVFMKIPAYVCAVVSAILYSLLTYLGIKFVIAKLFKMNLQEIGIKKFGFSPKWCITAILLPLAVVTVFICMNGDWSVLPEDTYTKITTAVNGIVFYSISAGIVEEMIFRCAIMGIIRKNYNIKSAVIIPSVLFGLVHIIGNDLDIISIIQLVIAGTMVGIMFSLVLLESSSFWNNALVHALWNMSTIGLIHIGTESSDLSVYTYVLKSDNNIITGGDFGIEASVVAVTGYIAVSLVAFLLIKKKQQLRTEKNSPVPVDKTKRI